MGCMLLISLLLGETPIMIEANVAHLKRNQLIVQQGYTAVERFDAGLSANGITPADPSSSWDVTGVSAPDYAWWGDDPTGSGGKTTHAHTLTAGATTEVNTGWCRDGSWSDISTGDCMKARRFDGNDYYDSDTGGVASCDGADCSMCAIYRSFTDGVYVANEREGAGNGEGWALLTQAGSIWLQVENHAGASANAVFNTYDPQLGAWTIQCGTIDVDGNQIAYGNGQADGSTASPGGTISSTREIHIGAKAGGANKFVGDILAVFQWNSLLDATDMVELVEYFGGVTDEYSAPVAFSNLGPVCGWMDGELECYHDNLAVMGTEIAPGRTGTGTPGGFQQMENLENIILYSRDLSTGWTAVNGGGAAVVACANANTPFSDGRTTCRITDDDAGSVEYIHQTLNIASLNTGRKVNIWVWARDASGTVLDLQVDEQTGAGCTPSTTDYTAATIDTAWQEYTWAHPVKDTDCEEAVIKIAPTDWSAAANTGNAQFIINGTDDLNSNIYTVHFYSETEASAVNAGASILTYDVSGVAFLSGGSLPMETIFEIDMLPSVSDSLITSTLWELSSGGANDRLQQSLTATDDIIQIAFNQAGAGFTSIVQVQQTGGDAMTAGTSLSYKALVDFSSNNFKQYIGGVEKGSDNTSRTSPGSLTDLDVGNSLGNNQQGYVWVKNLKVTK